MTTRAEIEADIYAKGSLNRDHLLAFLRLAPTSDSQDLSTATRQWIQRLHDDPYYSKVTFPQGDIDRITSDLESYGHITHETILGAEPNIQEFKGSQL